MAKTVTTPMASFSSHRTPDLDVKDYAGPLRRRRVEDTPIAADGGSAAMLFGNPVELLYVRTTRMKPKRPPHSA